MKKYLTILIAFIMIIPICGCSDTSGLSTSESTSISEEYTSKSSSVSEEAAAESSSVSEESNPESAAASEGSGPSLDENATSGSDTSSEDNSNDEAEQSGNVTDNMTTAQKNAYQSAKSYLALLNFSRQGLIDQLTSEYGDGYEIDDATFAIEALEANGEVDWNEQAYQSAKSYLSLMAFSRQGLIDQLTSEYGEQFEADEAEYAISTLEANGEVDWNEQAYQSAKSYLEYDSFSLDGLIEQLESEYGEQFTHDQATYGAEKAYNE